MLFLSFRSPPGQLFWVTFLLFSFNKGQAANSGVRGREGPSHNGGQGPSQFSHGGFELNAERRDEPANSLLLNNNDISDADSSSEELSSPLHRAIASGNFDVAFQSSLNDLEERHYSPHADLKEGPSHHGRQGPSPRDSGAFSQGGFKLNAAHRFGSDLRPGQKVRSKRSNIKCGSSFPCSNRQPQGLQFPFVAANEDALRESENNLNDAGQFVTPPNIRRQMIHVAALEAKEDVDRLFNQTEPSLLQSSFAISQSPTRRLWSSYRKSYQYAKDLSYSALIASGTSQRLRSFGLRTQEILFGLPRMDLEGTVIADICPPNVIEECVPGRYRDYSGHCNNVNNPIWGAVMEPLQRFLSPEYADDVSLPRSAKDGSELPSARAVSISAFTPRATDHKVCTLMLMQWAQFVYNDLVQLGSSKGSQLTPLPCCDLHSNHPECYPVNISVSDPAYRSSFVQCLPYARTSPAPRLGCRLGPREQINMATSYLDASAVYGSTAKRVQELRSFQNGKLKMRTVPFNKDLLPGSEITELDCRSTNQRSCFIAGSDLVNMLPTLAGLHTIMARQHNHLVDRLKEVNSHWDDERLFLEARRVVEAQIQHITFKEFLPVIVGMENMQRYGLFLEKDGYYSDYAININPSTLNVYAAAVGTFFFSMIPDNIDVLNKDGARINRQTISQYLYDPSSLYFQGRMDGVIRYLISKSIEDADENFSEELTSRFLKGSDRELGYDLPALIVQMGRDHGIPSYTTWRTECGLSPIGSWEQLENDIRDPSLIGKLKELYKSVDDVDLFVLGLAEKAIPGALLGPTFACLLGYQFQKVRRADRFWYENFFFPSAFTEDQLNEIRKTSLARIICDNTDDIEQIQPYVMSMADDFENCPIRCNSSVIPKMDLHSWIDSEPKLHLPITEDVLAKAVRLGKMHARELEEKEGRRVRLRESEAVQPGDPIFAHAQLLSPTKESLDLARHANILLAATKVLVRGDGLKAHESQPIKELDIRTLQRLLPRVDVSQILGNVSENNETCVPKPFPCDHTSPYRSFSGWCNNVKFPSYGNAFNPFRRLLDPQYNDGDHTSPYRSFSGWCNNVKFPSYGNAFNPFRRLLDPQYNDGFDEPRIRSRRGTLLPSPRLVSNTVHDSVPMEHRKYTHMLMQFGQFLDHDITLSPIASGPNEEKLDCSRCDSFERTSINCFPFTIPSDDPFFPTRHANGEQRCMPLARSLLGQLTLGYREQINQLSSFIDASMVYGSTDCQANKLRLFSMGKLNFTERDEGLRIGLPQGDSERECRSSPRHLCFDAGDMRSNEQTGLTAMHTVFLREHNRVATRLHRINNFWPDEKIYQESRRIVGAMFQHIVYNEFLPKVLGMETMAKYDLLLENKGYYKNYDQYCDAQVSNSFAAAAFRFGHTLIKSQFTRMDDFFHNFSTPLQLREMFMNSTPLYDASNGGIDTLMLGLAGAHASEFDRHISDDIRNHLFEKAGEPFSGMDLPAINIQRGRDHGLPPYVQFRAHCGLGQARSFDDLLPTMSQDTVDALRSVYRDVEDIDLFPGIITETPLRGALLGPTAACLIAEQFQRLRKCDRYWYENDMPSIRFTPDQLAEIRKASLAKIVCTNSQFIRKIQPNIFDMPDSLLNNQISCQDLPDLDLYEWLDRQFCVVDHRVINLGKAKRITPCVSCTCTGEGPECHSVRVLNCYKLLDEFLLQEVLNDTVCVVQCSAVIKRRSASTREGSLI